MSEPTRLQAKMGGPARSLDRDAIVAAARKNLDAIAPQIGNALDEQRQRLREAANSRALDLQGAFNAAHQICGLAGTIGRGSVGALADLLACYITDCGDVGSVCCQEVIGALTRTLDLAFDLREGEPILAEAVAVSMRLVEARAPRSIVEETSSMRSQA